MKTSVEAGKEAFEATTRVWHYHFDNGVFRGLAFANFRSASEADAAVAGLNGFDISGRKLRVEYKKVLQAGEKERIEKEKAIKRMRSMQLQKESSLLDQYNSSAQQQQPASSTHISFGNYSHHEDDFRGIHPFLSSSHDLTSSAQQAFESFSLSSAAALDPKQQSSKELDMNDPQTLELYSRVVVFKEDKLRDELAFAKALSGPQRRIVHQIAKKLGLVHRSEGQGDKRFVVVSKLSGRAPAPPRMSRGASQDDPMAIKNGQHWWNDSPGAVCKVKVMSTVDKVSKLYSLETPPVFCARSVGVEALKELPSLKAVMIGSAGGSTKGATQAGPWAALANYKAAHIETLGSLESDSVLGLKISVIFLQTKKEHHNPVNT
ncbi:hypothetical protein PtB15_6B811 [Puccinia triticina]|nr:hypothetical protein PtB15_6B811 [Puccinia triticina]